jgi:hypothetical protein
MLSNDGACKQTALNQLTSLSQIAAVIVLQSSFTMNFFLNLMTSNTLDLGLYLDKRLTRHKHIITKRKQLGITLSKLYWLLGRRSQLSLSNKLLIYKVAIKPIWTYGIQLWGTASSSNIEILERFQAKALRTITSAPWYVPNIVIRRDLYVSTVKDEICCHSVRYSTRLHKHPNLLATQLQEPPARRRLKRLL